MSKPLPKKGSLKKYFTMRNFSKPSMDGRAVEHLKKNKDKADAASKAVFRNIVKELPAG